LIKNDDVSESIQSLPNAMIGWMNKYGEGEFVYVYVCLFMFVCLFVCLFLFYVLYFYVC